MNGSSSSEYRKEREELEGGANTAGQAYEKTEQQTYRTLSHSDETVETDASVDDSTNYDKASQGISMVQSFVQYRAVAMRDAMRMFIIGYREGMRDEINIEQTQTLMRESQEQNRSKQEEKGGN